MTDEEKQTMNRETGEALIREGLGAYVFEEEPMPEPTRARRLVPHDFTDPRYLLPALEAYGDQHGYGWHRQQMQDPSDGCRAMLYGNAGEDWTGHAEDPMVALAQAFHAALTERVTG